MSRILKCCESSRFMVNHARGLNIAESRIRFMRLEDLRSSSDCSVRLEADLDILESLTSVGVWTVELLLEETCRKEAFDFPPRKRRRRGLGLPRPERSDVLLDKGFRFIPGESGALPSPEEREETRELMDRNPLALRLPLGVDELVATARTSE